MTTNAPQTVSLDAALRQAIAHHQAGRLQEAEQIYRAILQVQPNQPDVNHNIGLLAGQMGNRAAGLPYLKTALAAHPTHNQYTLSYADALLATGHAADALNVLQAAILRGVNTAAVLALHQRAEAALLSISGKVAVPTPDASGQLIALFNAGQFSEVENQARLLIEQHPETGFFWSILSASLHMQGKDALHALQKTAELLPDSAAAHNNLGNALKDLRQFEEAVASYRRALVLKSDLAEAHSNLGSALQDLGQLNAAVASLRRALDLKPDFADAHYNLGNALRDLGQTIDAVASYRHALAFKPDYAQVHSNLGNALQALGQLDGAVASHRRALEIAPDMAQAHSNLGNALRSVGQFEAAISSYGRALELQPDLAEAHSNLGNALRDLGRMDDAVASYRRALAASPDLVEAHSNLGDVLQDLAQYDEAVVSCQRALKINPDFTDAHYNLGNALLDLGQLGDAAVSYRRALELKPEFVNARGNLLFTLSHDAEVSADELHGEHRRFGEHFESSLRVHWPQHRNTRDPERHLQVGFVSGDFRNHAIANFIEPVLEQLARHPRLSIHAYYNHSTEDTVTQRLRGHMDHWNSVVGMSDAELAKKIETDGIDILIDLSGHTAQHRLLTFARKPAPIQASWMGYPGTTGLQAMDYYFCDRHFLPVEQFASQFTEKIVHLPANAPFLPFKDAPEVKPLPALRQGYVTFGSFNRLSKINPMVIALWAKLLRALPDAHMLLAGLPEEGKYDTLIQWFAQEGIARERLSFHARSNMPDYMSLHQQVDICLDTFPYTGGTTTMHALWMGVPTLTLTGSTPAGRQGASILGHVDLPQYVAHDQEDFVRKGVAAAGNLAALSQTRATLRQRLASSAMGQPELIADGLQQALRLMWQRWCNGLPAQALQVSANVNQAMYPRAQPALQKTPAKVNIPTPEVQDQLMALVNTGNALKGLGRLDEAIVSYRRAVELEPDLAQVHSILAEMLQDRGQLDDAVKSYRCLLELKPDFAEAHANLGNALRDLGRLDEAAQSYGRALQLKPDFAEIHSNLGVTLQDLGRSAQAAASSRRALSLKPDFAAAHNNLGNALKDQGQLNEAVASYLRALEITPTYVKAHYNLGVARQDMGLLDAAAASYRLALELKPEFVDAHSNLAFLLSHAVDVGADALFAAHVRFGEQFEAPLRTQWPQHLNSREPGRCLQVGFVSGDFRNHAIANFIEPVLAQLSKYSLLSIRAYYTHSTQDTVTQRLRKYFSHWNSVVGMSDAELAKKIETDGIDVLIDLSGHTGQNRLLAFARKPAPIQASWMGYPGTTGLQAMDYYFCDRHFLPVEQFASQFTEKIVHLPANAPFLPFKDAPEVKPLPALRQGYVTFGSFNRLSKINPMVIALWAKLLRALPDAHMLLAGLPEEGKYDTLIQWFAQEGIARERLSFHARSNMPDYMSLHQQVDICLDTFPYTGGTTTMHALWMGVPTLTLTGSTPAGRQGASILGHVDLPQYVAHDQEDFVRKGVAAAGNLAALSQTRATLRQRLASSAMGQPELIADGLQQALRLMWQRWCNGLPAQALQATD
jgi:predicted O-linked N-acetylglucosamine transferase (SPINDLY family)